MVNFFLRTMGRQKDKKEQSDFSKKHENKKVEIRKEEEVKKGPIPVQDLNQKAAEKNIQDAFDSAALSERIDQRDFEILKTDSQIAYTVYFGEEEELKKLLAAGEDPNTQVLGGRTLLSIAVERGHRHLLDLLLEKGADPTFRRKDGRDVLMVALERNDTEIFNTLWKHAEWKEINHSNSYGETLLYIAVEKGQLDYVKLFCGLEEIDVDKQRFDGISPLMIATIRGKQELVKELLASGSDVMLEEMCGATALCMAITMKHRQIIDMFYSQMYTHMRNMYVKKRIQLLVEPSKTCPDIMSFYKMVLLPIFVEVKQNLAKGVTLLHNYNLFHALLLCAFRCRDDLELLRLIFHLSAYLMYNEDSNSYARSELVEDFMEAGGPMLSLKIITGEFPAFFWDVRSAAFLPLCVICATESGKHWLKVNIAQLSPYASEFISDSSKMTYWIDGEEAMTKIVVKRFQVALRGIVENNEVLINQINVHEELTKERSKKRRKHKRKDGIAPELSTANGEENKRDLVASCKENQYLMSFKNLEHPLEDHNFLKTSLSPKKQRKLKSFTSYAAALKTNLQFEENEKPEGLITEESAASSCGEIEKCMCGNSVQHPVTGFSCQNRPEKTSVNKQDKRKHEPFEEALTKTDRNQFDNLLTDCLSDSTSSLSKHHLNEKNIFEGGDTMTASKESINSVLGETERHPCPTNKSLSSFEGSSGTGSERREAQSEIMPSDILSNFSPHENEIDWVANMSLKNLSRMLRQISKYQLETDEIRRPSFVKKQMELMNTSLMSIRSALSPIDVLAFVIERNLMSCITNLTDDLRETIIRRRKRKHRSSTRSLEETHFTTVSTPFSEIGHHTLMLLDIGYENNSQVCVRSEMNMPCNCKRDHFESPRKEDWAFYNCSSDSGVWATSTPKKEIWNLNSDEDASYENVQPTPISPNISLKSSDCHLWWFEKSEALNEDLYNGVVNTRHVLPAKENVIATTTAEFLPKDLKSCELRSRSNSTTSDSMVSMEYALPNFRLFHHSGSIFRLSSENSFLKKRRMYSIIQHVKSSLWFEYFLNLSSLITPSLEEIAETEEVLLYSSHSYYTLKKGCFGTYLGIFCSGVPVVVKCLDVLSFSDSKQCFSILRSIRKTAIHHENLTRIYDSVLCKRSMCLYVISEICEFTLEGYLKRSERSSLSAAGELIGAKIFILQLIEAIAYLHELPQPVIHGHLQPSNIFITYDRRLKVADYYLMKALPPIHGIRLNKEDDPAITSLSWRAQEVINGSSSEEAINSCTRASDVQVAGMLIYYIFTAGRHPFGLEDEVCQVNIQTGNYDLRGWPTNVEGKDLIEEMLKHRTYRRITISDATKHPYFWTTEKKFQLLLEIEKKLDFIAGYPYIFEKLIKSCLEARDWMFYIREDLLQFMTQYRTYGNDLIDLLRFAAQLKQAFNFLPLDLRKFVEAPEHYILGTFPTIFMSMYYVLRKNRQFQYQLKLDAYFYET